MNKTNGNVSTDFTRPFSINGLEFDLAELDQYENRLKSKRIATRRQATDDGVDDLDDYLERLALNSVTQNDDCERINATPMPSTSAANNEDNHGIACHSTMTNTTDSSDVGNVECGGGDGDGGGDESFDKTTFPLLLFGFLSILAFVNSVHCKLTSLPTRNIAFRIINIFLI